jgi:hypothetical protein
MMWPVVSKTRLPAGDLVRVVTLATAALLLALLPAVAADRYVRATVDEDGQLRILTSDGRTIEPMKEPEQAGFAKPSNLS